MSRFGGIPAVLRLPFGLVHRFDLRWLIAREAECWTDGQRWVERFELRRHERAFARELLARKRNLWLFRCDQRRFCGDFAAVDMSPPRAEERTLWLMELKMGAPLVVDAAAGVQLGQAALAASEVIAHGVVGDEAPVRLLRGGEEAVLRFLDPRCG